jgi:prepilin peptidase CpaA
MLKLTPWFLAMLVATIAGAFDWRYRRIPNWLTLPGLIAGMGVNSLAFGWPGLRSSLLGTAMGLALLLPLVLLKSLGAGDWKLVGALGSAVGAGNLPALLLASILVAGAWALALIIYKGRLRRTVNNIMALLRALLTLRPPGEEVSLDNPDSLKVPFGVAAAVATVMVAGQQIWAGIR